MPILFTCPHCGRQTDVADQFAGRTGPCAACGQLITIPGPVYLSPASVAEVPERSARGPWGMVWIIAVTAGILLLGVGVPLALILPAIQAAREAARRTQCHNYLTQIGMSLQNYHDTYKVFPMGAMHAGPANESARIGPSWWGSSMKLRMLTKKMRVCPYIIMRMTDGSARPAAKPTRLPICGQPMERRKRAWPAYRAFSSRSRL